jgi:hypothetical protein
MPLQRLTFSIGVVGSIQSPYWIFLSSDHSAWSMLAPYLKKKKKITYDGGISTWLGVPSGLWVKW